MKELNNESLYEKFSELWNDDKDAFEAERQRMIDEILSEAPKKHLRRLEGLQFQIDMERRRAKTPMAACLRISSMMWETFGRLQVQMQDLGEIGERPSVLKPDSVKQAQVISFAREDQASCRASKHQ